MSLLTETIEKDEEYNGFKRDLYASSEICFTFLPHFLEFVLYKVQNDQVVDFLKINKKGELEFDEKNSFEGIEKVAAEAQKVVSKFYESEEK
ncbi:MAG: hypothetical protein A2W82_05415 [Sulfurimonas sp. RIFCSPLOWO2_12_36_12]|nr:MAG: hypothetical protein A3J26_07925 [Sulfurimonas sp. RIFCSPLOWO2_02_FULL_36_28]OHE01368.1 MAG: hypothetical protein A2W82_05415 [Sulfurimonas sp. RIFCSPLOWO2_12_36_12]